MEPAPHFPRHGMLRIAALSPETAVANPRRNIAFMLSAMDQHGDADLLVYPELCITGYSCADLFACDDLLDAATAELQHLLEATRQKRQMICVGLPLLIQDALMNVAILICRGRPIAVVPKRYLPTYKEFYEGRWFRAGDADMPQTVSLCGHDVPCGIDVLVKCGDALIGMEICEDLWTPNPPSSAMAMAGANVLVNLSASNETIGKSQWRRDLVSSQSGRCIAAYAYASCGPTESSTDLVFSGDCMIGENGRILDRSDRVEDWMDGTENDRSTMRSCAVADIDLQRLTHDRRVTSSFDDGRVDLPHAYRIVDVDPSLVFATETRSPLRSIDPHPFVPESHEDLQERCREVFSVQAAGLAKRVSCLPKSVPLMIGVSGGLDSTLALLVAVKTMDRIGDDRGRIHGITMPGFGTTQRTRSNADDLMQHLGIRNETIDIRPLALQSFRDLGHAPLGIPINHETTAESLQQQLIDTVNELRSENKPT
ncbi:MAG: NAD(+) synthase [Planctomycetota bacterium]